MLNAHELVVQSAVVGRDVEGNEEVVAFVQLLPGARIGSRRVEIIFGGAADLLQAAERNPCFSTRCPRRRPARS